MADQEEKMLSAEEAKGTLDLLKHYLMEGNGDLPAIERHAVGRLLSEVQFTLEAPAELPENVHAFR
jgi:hypothetical protein